MKCRAEVALRESIAREARERLDLRVPFGREGPLFVATRPADLVVSVPAWEPTVGDGVVLHTVDGVRVLARMVQANDRAYVAEITHFGESAKEHHAHRAGDLVRFTYAQIVICWRSQRTV